MKLSELKKGDIFKWNDKSWEAHNRFHSIEKNPNGGHFIFFISMNYMGSIEDAKWNSYTSRDTDNIDVYIPKFLLSEQKRTKGLPCIPVSNQRNILYIKMNPINLSNEYCNHDKYWYDEYREVFILI